MNIKKFSTIINGITVHGDTFIANETLSVICLHGGGKRGRIGLNKIREGLAKKEISSLSFDYIGHGESDGELETTSLKDKVRQTVSIVNSEKIQKPITVIASSMGGYVAIKLLEMCEIENLILIAPAVYDKEAYEIPFGSRFSSVIRKHLSWFNSDAWEILKQHKGNLLIFKAEKDQIIPDGVVEKIFDSSMIAKKKEIVIIRNATHPLTDWLGEHCDDLDLVIETISRFIVK